MARQVRLDGAAPVARSDRKIDGVGAATAGLSRPSVMVRLGAFGYVPVPIRDVNAVCPVSSALHQETSVPHGETAAQNRVHRRR